MNEMWRYLGAAIALSMMAVTLREGHRAMGAAFALLAGTALLLPLLERIGEAAKVFGDIAAHAALRDEQTAMILKMLGVSFAAEFAAQACRDAGEAGIAMRVELCGKVMLLLLAAPLLRDMAQLILEMTA